MEGVSAQSYQSFNEALDLGHDICAMMSERVVVVECLDSVNCSLGACVRGRVSMCVRVWAKAMYCDSIPLP